MNKNERHVLEKRLQLVQNYFVIDRIIKPYQDVNKIKAYYQKSHFAYLSLISSDGFMHMGISRKGKFKKEDLLAQLKFVNSYVKKEHVEKVLELGCGNGSNSAGLARGNKKVVFFGLDLSKKELFRFKKITNYWQELGDYHDLSSYEDKSFDIVFAIETLCHSTKKQIVLHEVYNKLKKNGLFIIFDGYTTRLPSKLSQQEKLAKQLVEKSMAVETFERIDDFRKKIENAGFIMVKEEDLTEAVLPSMKRIERLTLASFRHQILVKFALRLLPFDMVKNAVAGLLMVPMFEERNVFCYYLHVLKK